MPVLRKDAGAEFPKQALDEGIRDETQVVLVLDVDATGRVTHAVVEKPVGHGFDEAAVAAAQKLEFEPAKRDGKPVAARIRYQYRFPPPPAVLSGRVVTLAGEHPIAGASVVVRDSAGNEHTATTADAGAWRIEGLPAGVYHVTVSAKGMAPHEADEEVSPGQEANAIDRLAPESAAVAPAPAGAPTEEPIEEVEVRGHKPPREVVKRTLEQREINRIPGTGGDALRSLQYLPGVARAPGFAGLLIVRGSNPQDTQFFIDGTYVPIVYHFFGLSSVVPTEILDRIDFYPGNFSSQYGRAMGGMIDVGLADPKKDRLHGMAEVNLIDGRVLVQGPLFDTGWNFTVGGRRSWLDVWLGPALTAFGSTVSVAPVYYDYQAILERDFSQRSSVRFALFGSDDRVQILFNSAPPGNPTITGFSDHTGFWRGQAIYKNKLTDETALRVVGAFGQDYLDINLGDIFFTVTGYPITSRVEISEKLDKTLTMNVGMDLLYDPYTVVARLPPLPKPGQPPSGPFGSEVPLNLNTQGSIFQPALYTEWEATPWRGVRIVPGVRLDYTRETSSWDLDPRVVVRQDVTSSPRTTLKGGAGVFSQPPLPQQTAAVLGTAGLTDNRSYHYDLGVERELTGNIEGSIDGFYKQLDNLVVQGRGNTGSGVIYGAEALLRYTPDERFFGWLAYTLSRSMRRDAPGMPLRLFQFDETHVLNVVGSYKLGRGWELGAAFRLISGYMYTPNTYGFYDENIGTNLALQSFPQFNSRLPLFQSLNLRVDKTWKRPWGTIGAFLDVLNVYNAGNVDGISYDYNFTHTSYVGDLPILPSLGLRVEN
jgi:TonB family protein